MSGTMMAQEMPRGTAVGKYEILRKLATGGMAEIYLARARGEAGFEKTVVLKRILPNFAEDTQFVEMFLDEARLAATMRHPNIADVYDVGTADGSYFFTMEFIHGEDARTIRIATRTASQAIPRPIALAIVHGTASGLHYAHDKAGPEGPLGIVHRDVSSSNVLVSFDGAVKIIDFGIARATSRQSKTRTGTLKGKIPYMSPEQCRNMPLDRRSDLFSLGVVLYELTVGRRPFRGNSDFEILDQIVNRGAPPPRTIDPRYPPALEAIVLRALAPSRDARYQTGEELLHDLETFMSSDGGWVSPLALGRYMRGLFANKYEAWESAIEHGASLADHVASTITSESMREAMRATPASGFSTQPEPIIAEPPPPRTTARPSPIVSTSVLRPRMPAWLLIAIGAALAVAITLLVLGARTTEAPPSISPSPPPSVAAPAPAPVPVPVPVPVPAAVPAPAPAPVPVPAPAPSPVLVHKPRPRATQPPRATPKPPTTAAAPAPPAPAPSPPPAPPKPPPTKTDHKEGTWDRNSLSLPK